MAALAPAIDRNQYMLRGPLAALGYDWWWHNFTARHAETGEEKAFFIEYFVCNPAFAAADPVFGGVGAKPSYGLLKVGCWGRDARQLHNYFGMQAVEIAEGALSVRMGQNQLSETALSGSVAVSAADAAANPQWASDVGTLRWQLRADKQIAYSVGYGASAPARALNLFEMYWHAQGIKTAYEGWVELDGERYLVTPDASFGYADKNWGSNFTSPWLWISSCDMVSATTGKRLRNSAVEIGGGQPKILGVPLAKQLLACLNYEGRVYDYNFSRFWEGTHVTFAFDEGATENRWRVIATSPRSRMELDLVCSRADMLLMRYQAPDGARRHTRLWNGGTATGEIRLFDGPPDRLVPVDTIRLGHAGCEYGEYAATAPYRS